jgi:DNA-binding NarL/FixJ family response regulator
VLRNGAASVTTTRPERHPEEGHIAGEAAPSRAILIVDDDAGDRAGFREALARGGYAIAEAASGEEALELAEHIGPAVVILDVCLPGISGYEVCHALRQRFGAELPIVFVSRARTESYDRVAGLLLGGDSYLSKPVAPDELLIHVQRLMSRVQPLAPAVARTLTAREREVLRLLAEGLTPSDIACQLVLSQKTVGTHIEHIFSKLGVRNRAQAVAVAYRNKLARTEA